MARSKTVVQYKISGKYDGKPTKKASNDLKDLQKILVGGLGAGVAIAGFSKLAGTFKKVADTVMEVTNYAREQEKVERLLSGAAKNNINLYEKQVSSLKDYASELQNISVYGDEAIIAQETLLASMGMTEQQIKDVLDAATNLTSSGFGTLESNVKNLAKTYGGLTGELGEAIPALKEITKEELINGKAVEFIQKQYAGMNEVLAKTGAGVAQQFDNAWGDLKENLGAMTNEVVTPMQSAMLVVVNRVNEAIARINEARRQAENLYKQVETGQLTQIQVLVDGKRNQSKTVDVEGMGTSLADSLGQLLSGMNSDDWAEIKKLLQDANSLSNEYTSIASAYLDGQKSTVEKLEEQKAVYTDVLDKLAEARNVGRDANQDVSQIQGTINLLDKVIKGLNVQISDEINKPLEQKVSEINSIMDSLLSPLDKQRREYDDQLKVLKEFRKALVPGTKLFEEYNDVLVESIQTLNQKRAELETGLGPSTSTSKLGFLDGLTDKFQGFADEVDGALGMEGGFLGMIQQAIPQMGELGNVVSSVVAAGGPLGILIWAISKVLEGFFEVIAPVTDALLVPIIGVLKILGQTIGLMLVPVLNALMPVITLLTSLFIIAHGALRPIFEFLHDVFATLGAAIQIVIGNILFAIGKLLKWVDDLPVINIDNGYKGMIDQGREWKDQDLFGAWKETNIPSVTLETVEQVGSGQGVTITDTGWGDTDVGSPASYSQARDITINITNYNEAIVGENGFDEFAIKLRNRLLEITQVGL